MTARLARHRRKIALPAVLALLLAICLPVLVSAEDSPVFELPPARGAVDMSGLETYMAPEAAPTSFQLQADQSPAGRAEAASPVLDKALGLVGLPGMSGTSADESTYEKVWRMSDSPNGGTRLTYGERYRRNPDGSYGAQSSSQWSGVNNVADRLLEQALSAGSGYFSSWAEGWLGGFGKARISVRVNDEGDVTGSGDFLYPIYDSERTTFFTQIGLRTMANDRVIGNFGLGQRFFPAENFALGYNVFLDQDFSRNHTRGGAGVEAWYDWLRLSANYYTPLSGWKDSEDYDSRLVEERPAEGYDARLTGYLPFYRNLAVTGAFEQWKGDHVGSFGNDDVVQKDPKVWSYGLEWTPVPAFSTSVNQRHSGGQKETQFGLTFNYHFGMDWEDQLSPATVTEMRTVDGSRHDFVNRQDEMILEYRAKNAYRIEFIRKLGNNAFLFRLSDGFGKAASGQAASVSLAGAAFAGGLTASLFTSNGNGEFTIHLDNVTDKSVTATIQAGSNSQTFTLEAELAGGSLTASDAAIANNGTSTLTFDGGVGRAGQNVAWSVVSGPGNIAGAATASTTTDSNGKSSVTLTGNATGNGEIKVKATVDGVDYEVTVTIGTTYSLVAISVTGAGGGTSFSSSQTAELTVELRQNGVAYTASQQSITWSIVSVDNSTNVAVVSANRNLATGLAWGASATASPGTALAVTDSSNTSTSNGQAVMQLTDIMGERTIRVKAEVTAPDSQTYEVEQDVVFGEGPLAAFRLPGSSPTVTPQAQWANVQAPSFNLPSATELPAAKLCGNDVPNGTFFSWTAGDYSSNTGLPTRTQLQTVTTTLGNGARAAAGWAAGYNYWTGELSSNSKAYIVNINSGNTNDGSVITLFRVVCLR